MPETRARLEQDIRDLQGTATQQAALLATQGANIVAMTQSITQLSAIVRDLNNTMQKAKGAIIVVGAISGIAGTLFGWLTHK